MVADGAIFRCVAEALVGMGCIGSGDDASVRPGTNMDRERNRPRDWVGGLGLGRLDEVETEDSVESDKDALELKTELDGEPEVILSVSAELLRNVTLRGR